MVNHSVDKIRRWFVIQTYHVFFAASISVIALTSLPCEAKSNRRLSFLEEKKVNLKSLHEVVTVGAPTTGNLIEGVAGAIRKGCRHRFYCYSADPAEGFLGSQTMQKPLSIEHQPGVFPAPSMGPASIEFSFDCQESKACLTPVVVRPDGTIFKGLPMNESDSPQTLVISAPAQTGIYTLFALVHDKLPKNQLLVTAKVSTQPQQDKTFSLQPFDQQGKNVELISAEFVYIP